LAEAWLAATPLLAANRIAGEAPSAALDGLAVFSLLRWAVAQTSTHDANSANLLHDFYIQRQTVEAVAERLAISAANFHKVRQPKAVIALAQTLEQLLFTQPEAKSDFLDFIIEDRYASLEPDEQPLVRLIALFRRPAPAAWVGGILALNAHAVTQRTQKPTRLHLVQWQGDGHSNDAYLAPAEVQAYWQKHLTADEAQRWHQHIQQYFSEQRQFVEAAHHQLELGTPEFAAQLLIAQHAHILEANEADDLLKVIARIRPERVRAETYAALKLIEGQATQATGDVGHALEAYRGALSSSQPHIRAEACYRYANALEAQDIDGALVHYQRGIELFQSTAPAHPLHLRASIDIAWIWLQARPDLDKAEHVLLASDIVFERFHAHNFTLRADLHNAWARWHHLKGDTEQGIGHRQQALLAANESGNHERVMKLAHNLGQDYRDAARYTEAMKYLEMSLALAIGTGNRLLEGVNQETIGGCYFFLQAYDVAIERYRNAREIFVTLGYLDQQGWAAFDLAEAYVQKGDLAHAGQFHAEATHIANQLGLDRLTTALSELPLAAQSLSRPDVKRLQRRAEAIAYLQQQGSISNRAYRALTKLSPKQATRDLNRWIQEGTLQASGQGRSVLYRLSVQDRIE
jgi:tetratricopeptide (TPR) repeat protein